MLPKVARMLATDYTNYAMEGRQIRAARALLGWSQGDLCERASISRATLNDLENDKGDPRKSSMTRVEEAFATAGVIFLAPGDSRSGGVGVRIRQ